LAVQTMAAAKCPLGALCAETFQATLSGIYESSPWVAARVAASGPFESVTALAAAMRDVVDMASDDDKLKLLRAHPDLAGKAALRGDVTEESSAEQRRAGLDSLSAEELNEFTELNDAYKTRFGFPFILAVRNATKHTILAAFRRRVQNDAAAERAECLAQVHKIAWMRLLDAVQCAPTGFLTCHVLDTADGVPAAGMTVTLTRPCGTVATYVTNADGRLDDQGAAVVRGHDFLPGVYEWRFAVGEYFAARGTPLAATPFLDVVPIRFGVDNPEAHYHVPLLCSPWSFSTYRGS